MSSNKVKIKLFASKDKNSLLGSVFHQLEVEKTLYTLINEKVFSSNKNEISLFIIDNLQSRQLNNLLDNRENFEGVVCIILTKLDALTATTLSRFGFNNLFIIPFEQYKLKDFLEEEIQNILVNMQKIHVDNLHKREHFDFQLIGNSPAFTKVIVMAKKIAGIKNSSILITGETGTGKGMLAKAIHDYSSTEISPFVDIHCAAIPETLLESELFGYEKGAFTDAKFKKNGLFEIANNGTLFLDEIGEISLMIQAKLLRAIDTRVIRRLGGIVDIKINSRIISATNRELEEMIKTREFREDLYHRLNVFPLHLPPLRERGKDISLLATHFFNQHTKKMNKVNLKFSKETEEFLYTYNWPGNVRELNQTIERAVLLSSDNTLRKEHFNFINTKRKSETTDTKQYGQTEIDVGDLDIMISTRVKEVLIRTGGNKSLTAKLLGISRPRLDRILKD